MAGGVSYVLDRVLKAGKDGSSKGAYSFARDTPTTYHLTHYGTEILHVDKSKRKVSGGYGYGSVSSSAAINQALNAMGIPCWWTRAEKGYGFWCKEGWHGDPSGPKHVADLLKRKEAEKKEKRKQRVRGGMFRIP